MWRWKQLMINFFHPLKFRNASENCKIVALEPKNHKKWARKLENQNCEKWSREGRDKSVTSLRTSYNASEYKSVDILPPSALSVAVKLCQSAAFQMKSEDEVKMGKNEPKNSRIKVGRNDRRKVKTSLICVLEIRRDFGGSRCVLFLSFPRSFLVL